MLCAAMGRARRLLPSVSLLCAGAVALAACGESGIELSKNDPNYEGAQLFVAHCSGCHTLSYAGTEGSATKVSTRERKDGPNFDQRKEQVSDVLYAIANGGYSSGPMPQDIVTGDDAQKIAEFIAKYSGSKSARPPSPQSTPAGQ
jgi:mono/diheme cytochrome c family protein